MDRRKLFYEQSFQKNSFFRSMREVSGTYKRLCDWQQAERTFTLVFLDFSRVNIVVLVLLRMCAFIQNASEGQLSHTPEKQNSYFPATLLYRAFEEFSRKPNLLEKSARVGALGVSSSFARSQLILFWSVW
jgi:hypothetical protein